MRGTWIRGCLLALATAGCLASTEGGGGGGGAGVIDTSPTPRWLVGSYSNGSDISNNVAQTGGDRELVFELDASGARYRWRTGRTFYNTTGTWRVAGAMILLEGGPLRDTQIALTPGCRIITVGGSALWRNDVVAACPLPAAPLSAEECALVGHWSWSTSSGTGSGSISSSEGRSVRLEVDRFVLTSRNNSNGRCVGSNCTTLSNYPRPTPGTWSFMGGVLAGTGVEYEQLRSWRYDSPGGEGDAGVAPTGNCPPGSIGTAGGNTGGNGDAGATDAGATDAGATDAGATDAGATDAGSVEDAAVDAAQ